MAEKEGFEPSLRYSHTTPLAGEPLEPLGYFSVYGSFICCFLFASINNITIIYLLCQCVLPILINFRKFFYKKLPAPFVFQTRELFYLLFFKI